MGDWFGYDESSGRLLDELNRTVLFKWPAILIALIVLFVIGVLMAHRLAGPMQGLDAVISAWKKGDRKARVHFRRYDYLLPMKDPLNSFLDCQEEFSERTRDLAESVMDGAPCADLKIKAQILLTEMEQPCDIF